MTVLSTSCIMHRRDDDGCLIPLYIGKSETFGRGDGNLSANLRSLHRNKDKIARWGDNYKYHIGDLSAVALADQRDEMKNLKYKVWAAKLQVFVHLPRDFDRY